jgi:hypothetical protein
LDVYQFWNGIGMNWENIHPSFRWAFSFFGWSAIFIVLLQMVSTKFFVRT